MGDDEPRTMTGIYEKKIRDHLTAKGEGWKLEEWERDDGYYIEVHERAQLRHRVRGTNRLDALTRMVAELRIP